jgi:hypothetical protein
VTITADAESMLPNWAKLEPPSKYGVCWS